MQYGLMISENDEEQEALLSLDKPGWYSQGNAIQLYDLLKKMTGKLDPKVCYKWESVFLKIPCFSQESTRQTFIKVIDVIGHKLLFWLRLLLAAQNWK